MSASIRFSFHVVFVMESYQYTPQHQAHSTIIDVGDGAHSYLLIVPDSALPSLARVILELKPRYLHKYKSKVHVKQGFC